jgi:uncharacterized protein (TIGR02285 family)
VNAPLVDGMTAQIIAGITGRNITPALANPTRIMHMIENQELVCTGFTTKSTEREKFAVFSDIPHVSYPSYSLIYRSNSKIANVILAQENPALISLENLLRKIPYMKIGVINSRFYSAKISTLQDSESFKNNFWYHRDLSSQEKLIDLVGLGRLDSVIDFPTTMMKNINASKLQFSYLRESPAKTLGYFMCPKTKDGIAFMSQINKQLAILSKHRSFVKEYLEQFPKEYTQEALQDYNQIFETDFSLQADDLQPID